MKKIVLGISLIYSTLSFAQSDVDALRYSQTTFGGTARALSMGGAFGALGGDLSSVSINPAGLAIYKRSELNFTPTLNFRDASSKYMSETHEASKNNFSFSNAGLVLTYTDDQSEWRNFNFAFGYNRINNFHSMTNFQGVNKTSSLLDTYLEKVNTGKGTTSNDLLNSGNYDFDVALAYKTGLIYSKDTLNDPNHYTSDIKAGGETQQRNSSSSGSMGEVYFAFGANYMDNLYLGATLSFNSIDYSEKAVYTESDPNNAIPVFRSFNLTQNFTTTGSGFNLKLGALYRVTDWFRLGLGYHTPTFFSLSDSYTSTLVANFDTSFQGKSTFHEDSPQGSFNYQLVTPGRTIGSIGFIIAKKGLLSVDYEYLNYGSSRFSSNDFSLNDRNDAIKDKYQSAGNLRLGAEYKLNNVFSLRGGYALYGNPYKSGVTDINAKRTSYTGGFGIRNKDMYVDFAYIMESYDELFVPYKLNNTFVEGAVTSYNISRYAVTLGFKF